MEVNALVKLAKTNIASLDAENVKLSKQAQLIEERLSKQVKEKIAKIKKQIEGNEIAKAQLEGELSMVETA